MARYAYYSAGELQKFTFLTIDEVAEPSARRRGAGGVRGTKARKAIDAAMAPLSAVKAAMAKPTAAFAAMFADVGTATESVLPQPQAGVVVVATETMVVEGATKAELKLLRDKFGMTLLREGELGKVLLKSPDGGVQGVRQAFAASQEAFERGNVDVAHPNFVRVFHQIKRSAAGNESLWNYDNTGNPGVPGADVAGRAAWTITRGSDKIRVAVLDEGVDTDHPSLKDTVVAEKDFVDDNARALPDGNDAHGTACAGTIVSTNDKVSGLASGCKLVAVRIAKGDGNDGWVFDDFDTADAIDWAWKEAKADVLSNSWGGGPPVDVITGAFERARTKGRGGKGAVIVIAAGNENSAVSYPGTLKEVLTVGASNQWDERKSKTSKDGETWWGSNFGPTLDILAPGVKISTTDIRGARGYAGGAFVHDFNGTSSATPHVAAAAALILSVRPELIEKRVREILTTTADKLTASGAWDKYHGHGRLNIFAALRKARR